MNIHSPSLSERERRLVKQHAKKELVHASFLIGDGRYDDDPDRCRDIAAALRKVAERYETLAGDK